MMRTHEFPAFSGALSCYETIILVTRDRFLAQAIQLMLSDVVIVFPDEAALPESYYRDKEKPVLVLADSRLLAEGAWCHMDRVCQMMACTRVVWLLFRAIDKQVSIATDCTLDLSSPIDVFNAQLAHVLFRQKRKRNVLRRSDNLTGYEKNLLSWFIAYPSLSLLQEKLPLNDKVLYRYRRSIMEKCGFRSFSFFHFFMTRNGESFLQFLTRCNS